MRKLELERPFTSRYATMEDSDLLLAWRNDPVTRMNSLNTNIITKEEHEKWLDNVIKDDYRYLCIVSKDDTIIGTVRFDLLPGTGRAATLSWTIAPEHRKQGIGKALLKDVFYDNPFDAYFAEIKESNIASIKIAEKNRMRFYRTLNNGLLQYFRMGNLRR